MRLITPIAVLALGWLAQSCAVGARENPATNQDAGSDERPQVYWTGTSRAFVRSSAGNIVGVNCHNCYEQSLASSAQNLQGTLEKLHRAQAAGADLLELDVKDEHGVWYVGHSDDGSKTGAPLSEVLADGALLAGDQLIYLELKEDMPTPANLHTLLQLVLGSGYAVDGREVFVRAFNSRIENLVLVADLLTTPELVSSAPYFKRQIIYTATEVGDATLPWASFSPALLEGVDGVELDYGSKNIDALLARARGLGLGTSVWTFEPQDAVALCEHFRDSVDAMTTNGEIAACRSAIAASVGSGSTHVTK